MNTIKDRTTFISPIVIGLLLVILMCAPRPLFAASNPVDQDNINDEPAAIKIKQFKVGVSYVNSYPLISSAKIEDKGFGWAVLEAFAKQNNIKFEYIPMPITRLQPSMDSGAIDFIFPDNPLWVAYRSNRFPNIYSGPIISTISSTFVTAANESIQVKDLKKVAIPFGYTAYTWFKPIKQFNIRSVPVRDLKTGLNSVRLGTVTAADIEYNIGQYLIKNDSILSGLKVSKHLPRASVDYHLSSIKHILVLEQVTAFVDTNQELIESLKQEYNIKYYNEVFKPLK